MATIQLEVDLENNEATAAPYWLILDPRQNMRACLNQLASQITGPFFSRADAERHLDRFRYRFTKRARVYCHSGCSSFHYKEAVAKALEQESDR